ncbi:MAG: ATP-dependent DNA helicase RecG, partial [Pedobacter sp.]
MYTSTLEAPIEFLKGVGASRADLLKKELGIGTYGDMLTFYPFRYIDRTRFYKISELNPELPLVQIVGRITGKETIGEKHKKRIVAKFTDETGTIELVWFQ